MPKNKKPKNGLASVDAYLELKAQFKDWLQYERENADGTWQRASKKLEAIRPEVLAEMQRLNLKAEDVSFSHHNMSADTLALMEQYTILNLEKDRAGERMVAVSKTREGNYGPVFLAFLECAQEHRFLHLDMVKEMFS